MKLSEKPYSRIVNNDTNYWYMMKEERWHGNTYLPVWHYTSSWTLVNPFCTYWTRKKTTKYNEYNSNKALRKHIRTGDVVQLKKREGDYWSHTIIISCKRHGTWRYAGHSKNHKWKKVSAISDVTYSSYARIRIK